MTGKLDDDAQGDSIVAPQPRQAITTHDVDVLQPEPIRQGGLLRHTFRQPSSRPTTPGTSMLGLDRLAQDKRSASANGNLESSRKKPRIDDGDKPFFKGL
jgi:pre-mRNA-splicing factor ATP-dependent RNA helicase DHX38/PRP16